MSASPPDAELSRYITEVRAIPRLSREDEHALAVRWTDDHDRAAGEQLVRANLRYVVAIAAKYRNYGLRFGDLVAEGNVGVVTALQKFDPHKGTRFVTYAAYWVRAFILSFVIRSWSLVGAGSGALRSKVFFRLRRERARIANMVVGRDEAVEKLAKDLGIKIDDLRPMLARLDGRDVSLDQPVYDDAEQTRGDLLESPDPPQDELAERRERATMMGGRVATALATLDPRERFIVERRIMTDDEWSLAEIGRNLGVSRERARQLEVRARRKLRERLADLEPMLEAA